MSEGGAIDWMGHANDMPRFIEEQIDFNAAVDAVIEWVEANSSWDETLLIVTSDHETGGIWGEGTWINGTGGFVAADRSEEAIEAARYHPAEDTFVEYLAVQDRGAGNLPLSWPAPMPGGRARPASASRLRGPGRSGWRWPSSATGQCRCWAIRRSSPSPSTGGSGRTRAASSPSSTTRS